MDQSNDGIIFYELRNDKDVVVARSGYLDNLPEDFSKKTHENFVKKNLRNAYRKNKYGSVHLIVSEKSELFHGRMSAQRTCSVYLSLIPTFKQIETSQRQSFDATIRRFSHNLIKFQKRFKDNFSRLISDKARACPYSEFKEEVKQRIENNTSIAADDICQISHRAIDLDAQIETLRIISGYADSTGTFLPTNIERAMYRLTNPFVDELRKKNIQIIINIKNAKDHKINIVQGLFNASIWQLFDNACKYALHDSNIEISTDLQSVTKKLIISMISISINEDEKELVFLESTQGKNVRKNGKNEISKDGTGIGLFIVRKALGYMKAKISVNNKGFVKEEGVYPYSKHVFEIEFLG